MVELAAAEMIGWLLGAGRGWGRWSPACRRITTGGLNGDEAFLALWTTSVGAVISLSVVYGNPDTWPQNRYRADEQHEFAGQKSVHDLLGTIRPTLLPGSQANESLVAPVLFRSENHRQRPEQ